MGKRKLKYVLGNSGPQHLHNKLYVLAPKTVYLSPRV